MPVVEKLRIDLIQNLEEMTMSWNVTVDADKCVGCGECVDVCPVEVYEMTDGKSRPMPKNASAVNPVSKCANTTPSTLKKTKH